MAYTLQNSYLVYEGQYELYRHISHAYTEVTLAYTFMQTQHVNGWCFMSTNFTSGPKTIRKSKMVEALRKDSSKNIQLRDFAFTADYPFNKMPHFYLTLT